MRFASGLATVSTVLLVASPALAKPPERAERTFTLSVPAPKGSSLRIANPLGTVRIRGVADDGVAKVNARAVAEAKTLEETEKLIASVRVESERNGSEVGVRASLALEGTTEVRMLADDDGAISRVVSALFDRKDEGLEVESGGRTFRVVDDRKAPGLAVHLDVAVPFGRSVLVRQEIGAIVVEVVRSEVRVETRAGSVEVTRSFGSLFVDGGEASVRVSSQQGSTIQVATGEGDVDLLDVKVRSVAVRTGSGRARIENSGPEDLAIESESGSIELRAVEPAEAEIRTGSGDVDFSSYLRRTRRAFVSSEAGNVVLRFGEVIGFDLTAEAAEGEVKALGLEMTLLGRDGNVARYRRGAGGADVEARAGTGKVTVCPYGASRLDLLVRKKK